MNTCQRSLSLLIFLQALVQAETLISCRSLIEASDKCSFVQDHCIDQGRIFSYLNFVYCSNQDYETIAILSLSVVLVIAFMTFGRAATRYLCPNLASISSYLHLPQSVAGVTLAAFGM